jgi:hypothetical protein
MSYLSIIQAMREWSNMIELVTTSSNPIYLPKVGRVAKQKREANRRRNILKHQ